MIKKLFTWENSLVLVPCLFALGAAFWLSASILDPKIHPYLLSFLFFSVAFAWTIGSIWKYDSFKKPRVRYRANSDRPLFKPVAKPRRRRNTKNRKIAAGLSTAVFATVCLVILNSYQKAVRPATAGRMEVFVQTTSRVRALPVPFGANPNDSTGMTFALNTLPYVDTTISATATSVRAVVILRNAGGSSMHGLHVRIDSQAPMVPGDPGLIAISPYQMERYIGTMGISHNEGEEIRLPIDIPISNYQTRTGILVTMQTDETLSYAAAAKLNVVRGLAEPVATELTLRSSR